MARCRELNAEIVSNASKVQTALKLSQVRMLRRAASCAGDWTSQGVVFPLSCRAQEDQNTISSLKREIEKAWKMVDASHEKEARAKGMLCF